MGKWRWIRDLGLGGRNPAKKLTESVMVMEQVMEHVVQRVMEQVVQRVMEKKVV